MRRESLLATMLLIGCQTVSPGSGPGSLCAQQVDFEPIWSDDSLLLEAENRCYIPMCVRLDFTSYENLRRPDSFPVEALIAPGERLELARVERPEPGKRSPFKSRIEVSPLHCKPGHAPDTRYRLPFGGTEPRVLTQGVDGETTHQGEFRFAFDFSMPPGTPVLAAREGTVLEVVDRFGPGGPDPALASRANSVLIGHEDGSVAQYSHLSRGVRVARGDRVLVGTELAASGDSGYSRGPHLHFAVSVLGEEGRYVTVPIRFVDAGDLELVPVVGERYGPASASASVPAAPE